MSERNHSMAAEWLASGQALHHAKNNHIQTTPIGAKNVKYRVKINICLPSDTGWRADITENLSYESFIEDHTGKEFLQPFSHDHTYSYHFK